MNAKENYNMRIKEMVLTAKTHKESLRGG